MARTCMTVPGDRSARRTDPSSDSMRSGVCTTTAFGKAGVSRSARGARTVVHDPEHPVHRRVGFLAHHLLHQPHEPIDAGGVLAPAVDAAAVHVVGGQVGHGAAAVVVIGDPR